MYKANPTQDDFWQSCVLAPCLQHCTRPPPHADWSCDCTAPVECQLEPPALPPLPPRPPSLPPLAPPPPTLPSASSMQPGDCVIIRYNKRTDDYAILLLADLRAGNTIKATDNGVAANGTLLNLNGDGTASYVPSHDVPAGTLLTATNFTTVGGCNAINLKTKDQLIVYTEPNRFLCALDWSGDNWSPDTANAQMDSELPPGLSYLDPGSTALTLPSADASSYDGHLTAGTPAELRLSIQSVSSWGVAGLDEALTFTVLPPPTCGPGALLDLIGYGCSNRLFNMTLASLALCEAACRGRDNGCAFVSYTRLGLEPAGSCAGCRHRSDAHPSSTAIFYQLLSPCPSPPSPPSLPPPSPPSLPHHRHHRRRRHRRRPPFLPTYQATTFRR